MNQRESVLIARGDGQAGGLQEGEAGATSTSVDMARYQAIEKALRDSEARLRLALASAGMNAYDWYQADDHSINSERCSAIYGTHLASGSQFLSLVCAEDRQRVEAAMGEAIRDRKPYAAEFRIARADTGEVRWIEDHGNVIFDEGDGSARLSGVVQDVTARKRAEEQLRLTQLSVDLTSDAIYWIDENANFIYVNEAASRDLGYTCEELLQMSVHDVDPNFPSAAWPAHWEDLKAHGSLRFETAQRTKDGRLLPIEVTANYRESGGRALNFAFARVISERKATEAALRESEERLKRAQEVAHVGSWELDLAHGELTWSDEAYRIFGLRPREFGATYEAFLALVHPDDRVAVASAYAKSLRDGSAAYEVEHRIVREPSGEVRVLHARCEHVRDANGRVIRSAGTVQDVTERRRDEDELKAAKAEAERANNAKSRFLAAASHDLRQPLAALSLYVGVLGQKLAPTDGALLKSIQDCVGSLSEMLSGLLDLSKLEAGAVAPEIRDFAVAKMLAKVVAVHAPEAQSKRLNLRCRRSGMTARTDPVLFERVVANLVANAIRYTHRGGVLVGCRWRHGRLWVEVWDTGIGIPEDKTAEIFEEFRQLGNEARERSKGSGLGLAIVAKTAALLGLQIRVRSRPGRGSMFAVEVPVGEAVVAAPDLTITFRPRRIGLVEDDALVAEALVYALTESGHQVIAAADSRHLLGRLDGLAPDLVISDYRLAHGETGVDVITSVRAAFGNDVPALLITGDTDPLLIRGMTSQGIRVQHKPIEFDALQICIAELIGLDGAAS